MPLAKSGADALFDFKCCIENNRRAEFLDWRVCRAAVCPKKGMHPISGRFGLQASPFGCSEHSLPEIPDGRRRIAAKRYGFGPRADCLRPGFCGFRSGESLPPAKLRNRAAADFDPQRAAIGLSGEDITIQPMLISEDNSIRQAIRADPNLLL